MKVKIAIIAATGSAYKRTIPGVNNSDICEISAIQGRNIEKLSRIAEEYNIKKYYLDEKKMLESSDYDMVYIANPPFMHYSSIELAAKYKKPIICEKPLDNGIDKIEYYKGILDNYNAFMVAHHLRHQKAYVDIKNFIQSGTIGDISNVFCQWGFGLNTSAANARWKLEPELGGAGTFSDNGIHVLDLMIGLFGKPKGVFGHCFSNTFKNTFDTETMMLLYDKMTVTLNASQTMIYPGNHLLIYGSHGKIEAFGAIGEKSIRSVTITNKNGTKEIVYPEVHLYRAEVENFIHHFILQDDDTFVGTSFNEAIMSLEIIEKMRKSSFDGKIYQV